MTINEIFSILAALEGPEWLMEQTNRDEPYGLMPALRTLAVAAIYDPNEMGSGVIYGDGGLARYAIDPSGTLRIHQNSVSTAKLEMAIRLGVIPT